MQLLLAVGLVCAAFTAQARDVGADIYARVADSVLLVIVENERGEVIGRGSAFVIAGGRLVTNAHVATGGRIFVKGGAFKIACTVEKLDADQDLAILKPSAELSARPLTLASRVPPSGSTVFALGNPQGLERTISQGLLTGTRMIDAIQMLQVSAAISPGSSGGPVVLSSGEVIGVATSSLEDGQSLNFAVPASAVRALIERPAGAIALSQQKPPSKLTAAVIVALEQSKLRYQKASDGIWMVTFNGDNVAEVNVYIQALDNMVMISSIVERGAPMDGDILRALLRASYNANFAKLALDEDGDILAVTELPEDFTSGAFKLAVGEVATLADVAVPLLRAGGRPATETIASVPAGRGATLPILRGAFELSYDPAKWRAKPPTEPGETELTHVSGDAYLKVISERIEIPLEKLSPIVLENAKGIAPDVTMVSEAPRIVNGLRVVVLRYAGTTSGIKFTFYNQLFSDTSGSIQLAGYTGTNLFDEYQRDFLQLFAGLRKVR